jgi:hypothetical protein
VVAGACPHEPVVYRTAGYAEPRKLASEISELGLEQKHREGKVLFEQPQHIGRRAPKP